MLPFYDKIFGFLSGKMELMNWEPSDLFQFFYDTKPIKGSLEALLALIDDTAVSRAIKIGACNIYHGCVHNMVYDKSDDILNGLYKSASYLIQAICFKRTGNYITCQRELLETVSEEEKTIVKTFMDLKNGEDVHINKMSERLFGWAKKWINN